MSRPRQVAQGTIIAGCWELVESMLWQWENAVPEPADSVNSGPSRRMRRLWGGGKRANAKQRRARQRPHGPRRQTLSCRTGSSICVEAFKPMVEYASLWACRHRFRARKAELAIFLQPLMVAGDQAVQGDGGGLYTRWGFLSSGTVPGASSPWPRPSRISQDFALTFP